MNGACILTNLRQVMCNHWHKILAKHVQKIGFNAACWSNHQCYVTCGCHFRTVSYFVLWYFIICPLSSRHLSSAGSAMVAHAPVSALCCVFDYFVAFRHSVYNFMIRMLLFFLFFFSVFQRKEITSVPKRHSRNLETIITFLKHTILVKTPTLMPPLTVKLLEIWVVSSHCTSNLSQNTVFTNHVERLMGTTMWYW